MHKIEIGRQVDIPLKRSSDRADPQAGLRHKYLPVLISGSRHCNGSSIRFMAEINILMTGGCRDRVELFAFKCLGVEFVEPDRQARSEDQGCQQDCCALQNDRRGSKREMESSSATYRTGKAVVKKKVQGGQKMLTYISAQR